MRPSHSPPAHGRLLASGDGQSRALPQGLGDAYLPGLLPPLLCKEQVLADTLEGQGETLVPTSPSRHPGVGLCHLAHDQLIKDVRSPGRSHSKQVALPRRSLEPAGNTSQGGEF